MAAKNYDGSTTKWKYFFGAVYEWNNENVFLQNERFLGKVDFDQWFGHDKLTFIDSIYKPQHNVQVKAYLH